ncbi:MDR family MFS transporter [Limnochorda pilosa]|nr:MDR family MFS transporter [Limnochorda pilosa]
MDGSVGRVRARAGAGARAGEGSAVQTTNRITGARRWWALGAVLVTMFFSSLDQTVVSTAMPVIIGELQGFSLYAWVFTAYMMASAITVPIYGKLSDVYGRKPFYVIGLSLFLLGSVASGAVRSMGQLIAARAFQGLGAGAMLSMPRATIGDIFNPRERGRWMGVISSVFGIASIVGPAVGGWITDNLGWRWVFYINLPVALLALGAVLYALPTVRTEHRARIDWTGSTLLVVGLVLLLLALTWAGVQYPWGSPRILGLFAGAFLFLGLFVAAERRAEEPVIAPELFRNRIFASTAAVALLISLGMFGSIMFLPLFVQGVLGETAQQSGHILTPMMLSFIGGSVVGGQLITRTGRYKLQAAVGALLMATGMYLLAKMGPTTAPGAVVRNVVIMGLGIGSVLPLLNVAVQNAFPYPLMGMVSATQQFVRSLGGIIAAPILGTVLVNTFSAELLQRMPTALRAAMAKLPAAERAALANPQGLINAETQAAIRARFAAFGSQGGELYHQFIEAVRGSLAAGTARLFAVGFIFAVLAVVSTLFLKEIRLKRDEFFTDPDQV